MSSGHHNSRREFIQSVAILLSSHYLGPRVANASQADGVSALHTIASALIDANNQAKRNVNVVSHAKHLLAAAALTSEGNRTNDATTDALKHARLAFESEGIRIAQLIQHAGRGPRNALLSEVVDLYVNRCADKLHNNPVALSALSALQSASRVDPDVLARMMELPIEWRTIVGQTIAARIGGQALITGAAIARAYVKESTSADILRIEADVGGEILSRIQNATGRSLPEDPFNLLSGWVAAADRSVSARLQPVIEKVGSVISEVAAIEETVTRASRNLSAYKTDGLTLKSARETVGIAASILALAGNPKAADDVLRYGSAAVDIASSVSSFLASGITGAALTGNVLAVGFTLLGSRNTGASPDRLILNQIKEIRKDIAEVKSEVRKVQHQLQLVSNQIGAVAAEVRLRFDHLSAQQRILFGEMRDYLRDISSVQRASQQQISLATRYISQQVAALDSAQRRRSEEALLATFEQELVKVFEPSLDAPLSTEEWRRAFAVFQNLATNASSGETFCPRLRPNAEADDVFIALIESGQMTEDPWSILNVFKDSVAVFRPQSRFPAQQARNIRIWSIGAIALCRLVAQHPREDVDPRVLDQVMEVGKGLLAWHHNVLIEPSAETAQINFADTRAVRPPGGDAMGLFDIYRESALELTKAIFRSISEFEKNAVNGLADDGSDPNVSFAVPLFREFPSSELDRRPDFTIHRLRLPSITAPSIHEGNQGQLQAPDFLKHDLPLDFALLDVFLGRHGSGFSYDLAGYSFNAETSQAHGLILVNFDIPGEGVKTLFAARFWDYTNWWRGAGPKTSAEWFERQWPMLIGQYNMPEHTANHPYGWAISHRRGLSRERRNTAFFRHYDRVAREFISDKLSALRSQVRSDLSACVRRKSTSVYPDIARLSMRVDALRAVVAISDSLSSGEYPRISFKPPSEDIARAVENYWSGTHIEVEARSHPGFLSSREKEQAWSFTGYWAPALVAETLAHLKLTREGITSGRG